MFLCGVFMLCRLNPHLPRSSRTVESWTSEPLMYVRSLYGNRFGFTPVEAEPVGAVGGAR